jgi:hypothetical protein
MEGRSCRCRGAVAVHISARPSFILLYISVGSAPMEKELRRVISTTRNRPPKGSMYLDLDSVRESSMLSLDEG